MTIAHRLNVAMNEALHCALAEVGNILLAPLEAIKETAMRNALNRDYGFTYDDAVTAAADALAEAEAETEVSEPDSYRLPVTTREYVPAPEVRLEDLAAHILTVPRDDYDYLSHTLALNIAGSLLDDFHITKK
ncbi:hypothetical protein PBI_BIGNUZ_40 [Mycobacterium phage BigNuz]|uniref:Uncharacterized protein n=1 Tax=Mycobacterium phage BigNuz TaxID=1074309 RepID=G1JX55_9CAUD|nr:hypothetical protein PBI_BIGNUZ_40 [Mycobacterium phage BigNuz]AEL98203.1 hypothetical protein PBI_BIGNUZ_40 [Mycobacterium phage BigNuz]